MRDPRLHAASAVAFLASVLLVSASAPGKEPVQQFLEGLRQRQYYDMAEAYLESLRNNPAIPEDVRQTIPYEQGRVLVDGSRSVRDMNQRMQQLDRAVARFEEFLKTQPEHPLAASASIQLGNVLVERGRAMLELSKKPSKADEKDTLVKQGRDYLAQARKVFEEAEKKFIEAYNKFPKFIDPKEEKKIEARRQVITDILQARLFIATVLYEEAKSYPREAPEFKQRMEEAAAKYHKLYEDNRQLLAGLYAGMWEARCYQELGDATNLKKALGIYEELLAQPDQPEEFRVMKTKVLRLALEAWTSDVEQKYEEVVKRGTAWLDAARPSEDRTPEGLGIRYYTALALDKQAEQLKKDSKTADQARRLANDLVKHALYVSRVPGEYQQLAKELLAKHRSLGDEGPTTFAEARDRGKVALEAMQVAANKIRLAPVTKDEKKVADLEKERLAARDEAIKYYELALKLRDAESPLDDVNVVRYFLTYLYYDSARYYDAAVMGEFLARKHPQSAGARPAAWIALAAYQQAYNASPPATRSFETGRMVTLAEHITSTWPKEREADEAWMTLGNLAIREGDLAKAAGYLAKIPEDSPRRGEADLKAGQAVWAAYLTANRLPDGDPDKPSPAELEQMAQQARQTLQRGIERMRAGVNDPGQVTYTLLSAELSLAQIYLSSGQADDAVALLEKPQTGALALVQAKAGVAETGNFPEETYKAALRAYVAAQQMDKAEQMMEALDARVAAKNGDEATLTKIYISLGRELGEQVEVLRSDPAKAAELAKVLSGFETFLARISGREKGNTYSSLNWVAETFFNMAEELDKGGALSEQAKTYYANASQTFQKMLERAKADPSWAPSGDSLLALEIQLARCERRLGRYKEALDRLQAVLAKSPNMLEAQRQAAYTYQEWGEQVDAGYYLNAMLGGRPNPKSKQNIIWGWAKLAVMVQRYPQYDAVFHEARYNLADCRYRLAMKKNGLERDQLLAKAELDVNLTRQLRKDLGGEETARKYDRLVQRIQQAAGRQPTGLEGLKAPGATAAAAR